MTEITTKLNSTSKLIFITMSICVTKHDINNKFKATILNTELLNFKSLIR